MTRRSPVLSVVALALAACALVMGETVTAVDAAAAAVKPYSPYVGKTYARNVYFGDTHLHTTNSPDAFLFGVRLGPDEALRFAKGEEVTATHGLQVKLVRPLDFLVVSDHAEYLGLIHRLFAGDQQILATDYGKKVFEIARSGEDGPFRAAMEVVGSLSKNQELMKVPELKASIWEEVGRNADRYNQPGTFTAFIGYEYTSLLEGNNLHRIVIFKDGADTATRVVPFSSFDSPDPEKLWAYMQAYEKNTGGEILAIPHNGNLSNGMMFQTERLNGEKFTREYAEKRIRWEPIYEVTQIKGDAETHPLLSPNDEFADFENWDICNLNGSQLKEDWMLEYEYGRSALKLGLRLEKELGVNPYKFGLIGSTDSHTGLATAGENNFWGKHSGLEPDAGRVTRALAKIGKVEVLGWQQVAGALAAVWARENTREALFDGMKNKETYATTGPRMVVRVFAGWDLEQADLVRPDFVDAGYTRGVPMGGDLFTAPKGGVPRFLVQALRDVEGANLERIQIIKGWLDGKGELRERVYDAAVSDGRKIGKDGRCPEKVGSTVDVANAT